MLGVELTTDQLTKGNGWMYWYNIPVSLHVLSIFPFFLLCFLSGTKVSKKK
jgi:hypothetical protein